MDPPEGETPSGGPPRRFYALALEGREALGEELRRMDDVVRHARGLELLGP